MQISAKLRVQVTARKFTFFLWKMSNVREIFHLTFYNLLGFGKLAPLHLKLRYSLRHFYGLYSR